MPTQKLIEMLETFIAGRNRSRQLVWQIEEELVACGLHQDDDIPGFLVTLDLFGVAKDQYGTDENEVASACREVLDVLRKRPIQPPVPTRGNGT